MTVKGHISKTLHFLYGQLDINVKNDGRDIDRHAGRVSFTIVGDVLAGCRPKEIKRKFIGKGGW